MLSKRQQYLKRSFDVVFSSIGILFLSVPIFILIILASISTKKIGLFTQSRIGQYGKEFSIYKIRSMIDNDEKITITLLNDKRITTFGKFLRKYHLDELPQLVNVWLGTMSFVGPRPDVKGYADRLKGTNRIILNVKPGITGPATLKFKNEEQLLAKHKNPKYYNDEVLWKEKIEINKEYILNWSFTNDLKFILKTLGL